ncbi:MAG: solute carrier family 23 protein [Verrucomicrobiota bacterium]
MELATPTRPTAESSSAAGAAPLVVYGLEDRLPLRTSLLVGAQHVAAMVVGTITPPLILASALKFSAEDTAYFINMALLASGLGALLQCRRRGPLGSGLLSVTGTSFAFVQPLIQAWHAGGFAMMFGLSCIAAPVQMVLAPLLPRLRRLFPPLVSGIVVLLIGASLVPTAFFGIATPVRPEAPLWWGLIVAIVVIAVVVAMQAIGRTWARITGVALAIVAGCLVCGLMGGLRAPAPGSEWIAVPRLLAHGFSFSWELLLPFGFIYLVSTLEAMGDMTATAQLSGLPTRGDAHWKRLSGGVLADGATCFASSLFGGFPSTTYAQNNGVIQITGVASRRVGYTIAGIFAVLGLFPAVGRWVTVLPAPVLGGLALFMFGLVTVSGIRILMSSGFGRREGLIAALAIGVGLGLPTQKGLFATAPEAVRALFESGISAGGLVALVLNLAWPAKRSATVDTE